MVLTCSELKRREKQKKKEQEKAEKMAAAAAAAQAEGKAKPKAKKANEEELDPNVGWNKVSVIQFKLHVVCFIFLPFPP